jgi:hypothetical protein
MFLTAVLSLVSFLLFPEPYKLTGETVFEKNEEIEVLQ